MPIFGLDLSSFQASLSIAQAKKQGYVFFAAKCTEGQGWRDSAYSSFRAQAEAGGVLFAAYHFLHSDSSATAQAANLAAHIGDRSIPVMIDCEPSGKSKPTLAQAAAFRAACAKLGIKVTFLYLPGFWWSQIGRPDLAGWTLWQANYGGNPEGLGSAVYPGDTSPRWSKQGGVAPVILQFGSRIQVSGHAGDVDCNAFKGSRAELASLFKDYAPKPAPAPKPASD